LVFCWWIHLRHRERRWGRGVVSRFLHVSGRFLGVRHGGEW
jgi:hypothetical protein